MTLEEFERQAGGVWREIPGTYRAGVDGLVIEPASRPHPTMPDVYTLGECSTEIYPSDWGGPDTTRSVLVLYYGSFQRMASLDEEFDWRFEIWETITHELRHHLESLADEDALEGVDYAVDQNFKRFQDEPFDPFFYRSGEPIAPGVYEADRDVFIEVRFRPSEPPGPWVEFEWHGASYSVHVPERLGDLTFIQLIGGVETGASELCIVLVRRKNTGRAVIDWLRRKRPDVVEVDATAQRRNG